MTIAFSDFTAPTYNVSANIHIEHTQLRDLVVCPSERGQVAYATSKGLATRNITRTYELERRIPHVGFPPTCVATGSGIIAAGGQHAEIYIAPLSALSSAPSPAPWHFTSQFRGSINNSLFVTNLTVAASPYDSTFDHNIPTSNPRIFVSNNDHSMRVFSVVTTPDYSDQGSKKQRLSKVGHLELKTCVNHASLSPDGRTLLAVGDTDEVYLYDVRGGDNVSFEPIASYKGAEDAGFATAWSSDGLKFAIASQDGAVMVWDVRSSIPTAQFHSQEAVKRKARLPQSPFTRSADGGYRWVPPPQPPSSTFGYSPSDALHIVSTGVRSLKFSPRGSGLCEDGRELLVFTEHVNNVHVVDARTFNNHTVIRVPRLPVIPPPLPPPTVKLSAEYAERRPAIDTNNGPSSPSHLAPPVEEAPWCTPAASPLGSPTFLLSNLAVPEGELDGPVPRLSLDHEADIDSDVEEIDVLRLSSRRRDSLNSMASGTSTVVLPNRAPEETSPEFAKNGENTHLSGLCFDPTGRYMYVGTEKSIVEWDVGSRRWGGASTSRIWEGSEWA